MVERALLHGVGSLAGARQAAVDTEPSLGRGMRGGSHAPTIRLEMPTIEPTPAVGADPAEKIATAVYEALPGDAGSQLLEQIAGALAEVAEQGSDDPGTAQAHLQFELARSVATDLVTGLPNRRRFFEDLRRAVGGARRYEDPLALVVGEVTEEVDDDRMRALGEAILRKVRVSDLVARIGPTTFAVILSRTGSAGAALVSARLAEAAHAAIAFGHAELGADVTSAGDLLQRAQAMIDEVRHSDPPHAA
jgi:diguanylate cyclase (GGDEF)-like protein